MAQVLVADDDFASIEVLSVALAAEGHEVLCADDGHKAYDLVLSKNPAIVFLDVMMPGLDGYETCRRLRENPEVSSSLPIILLTSLSADRELMREVGATDHLSKRHMVKELQDVLTKYLGPEIPPNS